MSQLSNVCLILFFVFGAYFLSMRLIQADKGARMGADGFAQKFFGGGVTRLLGVFRRIFHWRISGTRMEQMKKIYVGKKEEEIFYLYYGKVGCYVALIVMIALLVIPLSSLITQEGELFNGYFLKREDVMGQEKTVDLTTTIGGEEKEVSVSVPSVRYTQKEQEEKFAEAKAYIDENYLGQNASAEEVNTPLNLVTAIPDSAVTVEWDVGVDGLIGEDGSIENTQIEEETQTQITATLAYADVTQEVVKQLTILPQEKTEQELVWQDWETAVEKNQELTQSQTYLKLPDDVDGNTVRYAEKELSYPKIFLGVAALAIVAVLFICEEKLDSDLKRREREMRADYPEFVEHFVLLIGAGMTVKGAWERIVSDYQKRLKKQNPHFIYEEMAICVREMENGMSEARAYELFGKRIGQMEYIKFCTLVVQNLRKGSADLLHVLQEEVTDAFQERKENAKTLGEEAGTKLLMPMMIMLVIVFAEILYAAFQSM